jgi:hypothetical protein
MGPDRVEVTQDGDAPIGVAAVQVAQHVLDDQLGAPVGVGGRQRVVLGQRQALGVAVHRGRRTEHQLARIALHHGLQQAQRAQHVVVVVGQRLLDRFPDRLQAGEVDHGGGADCRKAATSAHGPGCRPRSGAGFLPVMRSPAPATRAGCCKSCRYTVTSCPA